MLYITLVKYLPRQESLGISECECEYERARGSETVQANTKWMHGCMLLINMKPRYKTPKVNLT